MQIFRNIHLFKVTLFLIALHSFMVGVALIALPTEFLRWFGFTTDPLRFFSTQGGVFHIVMSVAYYLAARNPQNESGLLIFIISAKIIAFLFLGLYYFFGNNIIVVALSAISDGFMGLIVLLFYIPLFSNQVIIDE